MKFIEKVLDVLFSHRCMFCGNLADADVCEECWKKITWITEPVCEICGQPFETSYKSICKSCMLQKPNYDIARAIFSYDEFTKTAILNFKNKDATYLAKSFSDWIKNRHSKIIADADIIIPVPIHRRKLFFRLYNQAAILAKRLSDISNIEFNPLVLEKLKSTHTQEGLSRIARLKNLVGAFSVNEKYASRIKNKNILLIDDVLTTGATANECAKTLKSAGAKKVFVITVAKVI